MQMTCRQLGFCNFAIPLLALLSAPVAADDANQRLSPSPWFGEKAATFQEIPQVRIHVNLPAGQANAAGKPTRLIVYALPNGNTLEQTLGCKMAEGLDWHYDIQHA